jgi:hypothetical protein
LSGGKSISYGQALEAVEPLATLGKIGCKDLNVVRLHARMLRYVKAAVEHFETLRDTLLNEYAQTDDDGERKVIVDGDKQSVAIDNPAEFREKIAELLKAPVDTVLGFAPRPFTWAELEKFKDVPDALTVANLGPFLPLGDE